MPGPRLTGKCAVMGRPLYSVAPVGAHSICARAACGCESPHGRIWNPPLRLVLPTLTPQNPPRPSASSGGSAGCTGSAAHRHRTGCRHRPWSAASHSARGPTAAGRSGSGTPGTGTHWGWKSPPCRAHSSCSGGRTGCQRVAHLLAGGLLVGRERGGVGRARHVAFSSSTVAMPGMDTVTAGLDSTYAVPGGHPQWHRPPAASCR